MLSVFVTWQRLDDLESAVANITLLCQIKLLIKFFLYTSSDLWRIPSVYLNATLPIIFLLLKVGLLTGSKVTVSYSRHPTIVKLLTIPLTLPLPIKHVAHLIREIKQQDSVLTSCCCSFKLGISRIRCAPTMKRCSTLSSYSNTHSL